MKAQDFQVGQAVKFSLWVGVPKSDTGHVVSTKPGWVRLKDSHGIEYNVRPNRIEVPHV